MLALELGQTIIENKFLGLGDSVLGSSLVIEAWWGGGVDGGVKEHGCDRLATPSRNLSKESKALWLHLSLRSFLPSFFFLLSVSISK